MIISKNDFTLHQECHFLLPKKFSKLYKRKVASTKTELMETIDEPKKELNLGNEYLEIQSSYVVKLKEVFTIHTKSGTVYLEVDISADMVKVPEEYREIFMNMMTAKYLNRISVCNTGVFCGKEIKEKPWWKKRLLKWLNRQ